MSKMGNHRIKLQEHPDYELGFKDREKGSYLAPGYQEYRRSKDAYDLGWDDAAEKYDE